MNFWNKITGNDITKEMKSFEFRVKKLPDDYKAVWEEIKINIWDYSDFSGRNLIPILEGIISLLEEASVEGQSAELVLGKDIKGFCRELAGEYDAKSFRDKCRIQLNRRIAKNLSK